MPAVVEADDQRLCVHKFRGASQGNEDSSRRTQLGHFSGCQVRRLCCASRPSSSLSSFRGGIAVLVRNLFALGFLAHLARGLAWVTRHGDFLVVLAVIERIAVVMSLSAFTRVDYPFSAGANIGVGALPCDAAQIAPVLGLPSV